MRKSRFTESQIVSILKQLDAGTPATAPGARIVPWRKPCGTNAL